MKITYKNAIGLFTLLFIAGVLILAVSSFLRGLPAHGTVQIVGIVVLVAGLIIYLCFWRCPACRELLPRQITIPPDCKSCGARLLSVEDEGEN